jgi:hypothetical protein
MTRTWIATAVALCVQASGVSAQVRHFTVSTPTVSVYKAPTNVSPVIGEATQGTTLEVTRDVGGWVKVPWPKAAEGVGYIRKNAGTLSVLGPAVPAAAPIIAASAPAASPHPAPLPASRVSAAQSGQAVRSQAAAVPIGYVAPIHRIGMGGQIGGSAFGAGFSARGWSRSQHVGVQFDLTRYSMSNDLFLTPTSVTQFGPRVLYAFRDRVSDRTWVRPYAGVGAHVMRSSMTEPLTRVPLSETGMSAQLFGGSELTLSAVPRLGLSADVGYQWYRTPFANDSLGGASLTLSAHWYVK